MDASIARVSALSAEQRGLVTRAQLLDLGRSKHQIDYALATQRLSLVLPGVYRISGAPLTADGALAAALLLTEGELLIWQILRRHHVPLPERQVKVRLGRSDFRLDLAYCPERIFIEGDGFGVHSTRSAFESDRARQNTLVIAGWLPLRFTWQQARCSEDEVADQVRAALVLRLEAF